MVHALLSAAEEKKTKGALWDLSNEKKELYHLIRNKKHRTALEYQNDEPDKFNDYYKFAIVRNPWERMVSEFHWRSQRRYKQYYSNFTEFLILVQKMQKREGADLPMLEHDIWIHTLPQYKYLIDDENNLIVDDIYKFSNLNKCIAGVNKKLKINMVLETHNKTKHKHYSEYYSARTREIVNNIYSKDIEMFGFQF